MLRCMKLEHCINLMYMPQKNPHPFGWGFFFARSRPRAHLNAARGSAACRRSRGRNTIGGNAEVIGFCLCNQKNAALAVRSTGGQGDQNAGKICKTLKNQRLTILYAYGSISWLAAANRKVGGVLNDCWLAAAKTFLCWRAAIFKPCG